MSAPKFADWDTRMRIDNEARRYAHGNRYVPTCKCGRRMNKDDFNGMWHCWERDHGGYQTEDQVAHLIYLELLRNEGYTE